MYVQNIAASGSEAHLRPIDTGHVEELTINWHITEACNYRCQYCYARWIDHPDPRELFHDSDNTFELLNRLYRFFHPKNTENPIRTRLSWNAVRLNIAGGEPSILNGRLLEIVQMARDIGFQVSIISNGSRLSSGVLEALAPYLTCIGVSLDSLDQVTNQQVGRIDRLGRLLNIDHLVSGLQLAKAINPQITVKLNTVVNRLNVSQDLGDLITKFQPDRWKILRMLPVVDRSLAVSDEAFSGFVFRHRAFESIQCIEDNQDMCESYLMVDPYGRFFQNRPVSDSDGYVYSNTILSHGCKAAFSEMAFNPGAFLARYRDDLIGGRHEEV